MKRAKLTLAAIAVLAVVGGTLAFKANNTYGVTIWKATQAGKAANVAAPNAQLTPNGAATTYFDLYTSVQGAIVNNSTTAYYQF